MNKIKVALITRLFDVKGNAGLGRVATEVRNGLIERGYDVVTMGSKSESLHGYFKYLFWDIPMHLPQADIYIACTPMESIFLPKEKTISIVHDLIPLLYPDRAGARMNESAFNRFISQKLFWLGSYNASKCKRIVCNSTMTENELVKYFNVNPKKVKQIDLGVRPELDYQPKKDNTFRVGYLGQLDKRKRVDLLINAFKDSDINGELVIAWSGIERKILEVMADGDKRIKFLGFVPDSSLVDFYNSLDVFAFPTAVEGFGIPIVEAMACKKPVLVWEDSIIPPELKVRCYKKNDHFNQAILNNIVKTEKMSSYFNYDYAHSLSWDKFVDGIELTMQEVMVG